MGEGERRRVDQMSGGLVAQVVRFGRLLRARGVDVGTGDDIDGVRALALVDLSDRAEVRRALRIAFKVRRRHWDEFDQAFEDAWMGPERTRNARSTKAQAPSPSIGELPGPSTASDSFARRQGPSSAGPRAILSTALTADLSTALGPVAGFEQNTGDQHGYTPAVLLRKRPFDACSSEDLDAMTRLIQRRVLSLATRRSRRLVPSGRAGVVDMRRSFRLSLATGGEPLVLPRRAHPIEDPRLVVLCDTSRSMDTYSRFLLAFVLALRRVVRRIEVFAFNTSLTHLTSWLVPGDVVRTLRRVQDGLSDWSGGTKIGESLSAFVRGHLDELVNRKTIVAIFSDGLDTGDTALVADAMEAIHAKACRVVWLNPLAGDVRYEPTARAMQVAMPFIDCLAPAHDLDSLEHVLSELATLNRVRAGWKGFQP